MRNITPAPTLMIERRLPSNTLQRVRFRKLQRLVFLGSFAASVFGLVVLNQVYLHTSLSVERTAAYSLMFLFVVAGSAPFALNWLSHRNGHSEISASPPLRPFWLSPFVASFVLSISLAVLALTTYQLGMGFVLSATEHRLQVVATLKASLISTWVEERRDDIRNWSADLKLSMAVANWRTSGTRKSQSELLELMTLLAQSRHYLGFSIWDAKTGARLLTTGEDEISPQEEKGAIDASSAQSPVLENFHRDVGRGDERHLEFFFPLSLSGTFDKVVMHVRIDLSRELFPFVEQWSGERNSNEVLLLRVINGTTVVLNDKRYPPHGPSQRQLSTETANRIETLSKGNGGFMQVREDQNREILAYAQPVSGTPWILFAKIDRAEVFMAFRLISWLVASIVSILLFTGAWWWLESNRHAELERIYQLERAEHDQRLIDVSHRLMQVQEEERRRLAVELHDWTGGNLAAINLNLKSLAKSTSTANEENEELLQESSALLADTIFSIREICGDLRPSVLDYSGLTQAIDNRLKQFTQRTGIESCLEPERFTGRCTAEIETTLYRIVQEALLNCAKHSSASHVLIRLSNDDGHTVLRIEDDGVGFAFEELGRDGRSIGHGLQSMQERAGFVGGSFTIDSNLGGGTCICVTV